jgi:transcription initiation factor TFIID subunit 7
MLLVDESTITNEEVVTAKKAFNANEFIYTDGLTPPLRHVRKRRFRKRLNRQVRVQMYSRPGPRCLTFRIQAIENVENEVDRLLSEDRAADQVDEPSKEF